MTWIEDNQRPGRTPASVHETEREMTERLDPYELFAEDDFVPEALLDLLGATGTTLAGPERTAE